MNSNMLHLYLRSTILIALSIITLSMPIEKILLNYPSNYSFSKTLDEKLIEEVGANKYSPFYHGNPPFYVVNHYPEKDYLTNRRSKTGNKKHSPINGLPKNGLKVVNQPIAKKQCDDDNDGPDEDAILAAKNLKRDVYERKLYAFYVASFIINMVLITILIMTCMKIMKMTQREPPRPCEMPPKDDTEKHCAPNCLEMDMCAGNELFEETENIYKDVDETGMPRNVCFCELSDIRTNVLDIAEDDNDCGKCNDAPPNSFIRAHRNYLFKNNGNVNEFAERTPQYPKADAGKSNEAQINLNANFVYREPSCNKIPKLESTSNRKDICKPGTTNLIAFQEDEIIKRCSCEKNALSKLDSRASFAETDCDLARIFERYQKKKYLNKN